ncbi:hypothetical protein ACHWQZ_G003623 [Mnemiopsis leidyi]
MEKVAVLLIMTAACKPVISTVNITNGTRPHHPNRTSPNCSHQINGISGACSLQLSNFTLLGAHSAGAGAYGNLEILPGITAPDCEVRNQDISFSDMLESGVRYFDVKVRHRHSVLIRIFQTVIIPVPIQKIKRFSRRQVMSTSEDSLIQTSTTNSVEDNLDDLSQIRKRRSSLPSLPKNTLFLYHDGAYSKPIEDALKEIDTWLGDHANEIVVLRVTNTDDKQADISGDLARALSVISHTGLNEDRNANLGVAVKTNKRIVLFLRQEKHWKKHDPRIHPIVKLDTTVNLHKNCVVTTTLFAQKFRQRQNHHIVSLSTYLPPYRK